MILPILLSSRLVIAICLLDVISGSRPNEKGSCTFETGAGLCGYTNIKSDIRGRRDWLLGSSSASYYYNNEIPRNDHTGNGHYIYIRTGFHPRWQGYPRAQIISPQIIGGKCVRFYHHMRGSQYAQLNVYVKHGNNKTRIWQQIGGQYSYSTWMMAMVPIEGFTTFQIIFEGGVFDGTNYFGDIALDDIQILNETCIPDNSGNCTFDNGNLCGYKNAKDDDGGFDWVLHTGVNPNFNGSYGPQQDHTTGTGNFVQITPYVDRWWHRKEGKEARLVSPEIFGAKCVQFYYHMKGRGNGKLNVLIDNGKSKIMVWQLSGDQSSTWSKGMLPVKGLRTFKIIFEGVAGTNYKANIAVDDIKVFNDTCASFPSSSTNFTSISNHFRVVGGVSQSEGIIKIKYRGTWGTICNDGWDVNNAKVVCRQMGYSKVVSLKLGYAVSPSFGIINPIIRLQCKGTESSISLCAYEPVVSAANNCNQAAQVICENQNVRLVGGKTRNEGIVQVFYGFRWGTICNRGNWDMNDAKVVCRQLGYSKVVSLKLGYHAASYHSDPIIRKLKCKGNESFVRLCAFESLLSIGSQNCNHSHDSQVVCSNPVPPPSKACHPRCPRCQKTVKNGDICVCSLKNTDAIYQWCDASIGLDVMKVLLLNLSMDQWNAVKFKTSLADQLNIYCKNIKCGSQSKFDANDVIVLDNYPKVSNGQDIVLQFIVLDLNSKRPIPQDVLYSMLKINHNLAGYLVKLPDRHVKTISHARTGISSKHLKLVIPIVVVVVIGIALALFVVFKKRKNGKFSLAVGYHGSNSNECLTTKMQT